MKDRAKSIAAADGPGDPENRAPARDLVGATEAAKLLGISVGEFQRRRRAGYYEQAGVDERGYRWYDRDYLERRKRELPVVRRRDLRQRTAEAERPGGASGAPTSSALNRFPRSYDPETATAVFDTLARDEDLVRIVKLLKLHPEVVRAIHAEWLVLRQIGGGYHVSGAEAREIATLGLDGFPCASGEELVAALRCLAAVREWCGRCGKHPRRTPRLCSTCEDALREREHAEVLEAARRERDVT